MEEMMFIILVTSIEVLALASLGVINIVSGRKRYRRLQSWGQVEGRLKRYKKIGATVTWMHRGIEYSGSAWGMFNLLPRKNIKVFLDPDMPTHVEVNHWSTNGFGRIITGVFLSGFSLIILAIFFVERL